MASAKTYTVTLYQAVQLGGKELKPGAYRVEVNEDKAVFKNGPVQSEAPVKVENSETRFATTSVRLVGDGTPKIDEIRIGGSKTVLKFGI